VVVQLLRPAAVVILLLLQGGIGDAQSVLTEFDYPDTRELVSLVADATELVRARGEAVFGELAVVRHGEMK